MFRRRPGPPFPDLPFPGEVVAGRDAEAALERWRRELPPRGERPLLAGDAEDVARLAGWLAETAPDPAAILAAAARLDPAAWLAERARAYDADGEGAPELGAWPRLGRGGAGLQTPRRLLVPGFKPRVALLRIRAREAWELPAHLGFGGWNACPPPEALVALAQRWADAWGAEPVAATFDTLEFRVARPPATREAALELAREQWLVCPDTVEQGTTTLAAAAATLLGARTWFFWWD